MIPDSHDTLCYLKNELSSHAIFRMQLYWKQWSGKDTYNDRRKPEANQNDSVFEQSNQKKSLDDEVVAVVTRPGHIRFELSEKGLMHACSFVFSLDSCYLSLSLSPPRLFPPSSNLLSSPLLFSPFLVCIVKPCE